MSFKINRYEKNIQREISYIINELVSDKFIKKITITDVKLTNDLSFAKIYYTILDSEIKEQTQQSLDNATSFIRTELANKINIRHTPKLNFIYDESIEYGNAIEKILEELN